MNLTYNTNGARPTEATRRNRYHYFFRTVLNATRFNFDELIQKPVASNVFGDKKKKTWKKREKIWNIYVGSEYRGTVPRNVVVKPVRRRAEHTRRVVENPTMEKRTEQKNKNTSPRQRHRPHVPVAVYIAEPSPGRNRVRGRQIKSA